MERRAYSATTQLLVRVAPCREAAPKACAQKAHKDAGYGLPMVLPKT